jgi:hypothetical protein
MTPKRIQRQRTKGWRMPEGAVYVGRPTKWGNPWRTRDWTAEESIEMFESLLRLLLKGGLIDSSYLAPLQGKDLACWCPSDKPCHADVLLGLANE